MPTRGRVDLLHTFSNPAPVGLGRFGYSLAALGENVLVGARGNLVGQYYAGVVYLFDGETGDLLHTFVNPTPDPHDSFGASIAVRGNKVLIGAYSDDDISGRDSGAVYLFNASTGDLLRTFRVPEPSMLALAALSAVLCWCDVRHDWPPQRVTKRGGTD